MKRLFTLMRNKFTLWFDKKHRLESCCILFGILVGICACFIIFTNLDTTPATAEDYQMLEVKILAIEENPMLLFETQGTVTVGENTLTVEYESTECSMTAVFDKQTYEILSATKTDAATSLIWAILGTLFVSVYIGLGGFVLSFLFCIICWGVSLLIRKIVNSKKVTKTA